METTYNTNAKLAAAKKKVHKMKGFYRHALVYILVNTFIILTAGFGEKNGFADLGIFLPALFWGFGLACHGISVFAGDWFFGTNWEERKIQQLMNQ